MKPLSLHSLTQKMKLTKDQIKEALSHISLPNETQNIIESGAIKNVQGRNHPLISTRWNNIINLR